MNARRVDLPVAVTLRLQSRSGSIDVIAEPRDDVEVDGEGATAHVEEGGSAVTIRAGRGGSRPMTVRCPVGTDINMGTQSGTVTAEGEVGTLSVTTISGTIDVEAAEQADLRTMSGQITLGRCSLRCRMGSVSGRVSAGAIARGAAQSISGAITINDVAGDFKARSVNGTIDVRTRGVGRVAMKTVSGKIRITLPPGTAPETHFKTRGRVESLLPAGHDCIIEAGSMSGSIELVPG